MEQEEPTQTQTPNKAQTNTENSQQIFAYGSTTHNQYASSGASQNKAINLTNLFTFLPRQISSIAVGGFHTLLLTTNGEVYSFGSNEDSALGRSGNGQKPAKVEFDHPIDMISAGESHSVAVNSNNCLVYQWGVYYNASKGIIAKTETPQRIGEDDFKKKTIQKVVSGANHTLVLFDGKIFAWGDAETGILGRVSTSRRKVEQGLKVEGMGVKGVVDDIYTGAYHAFLKKTEKKKNESFVVIQAWGQNESGQLGLGHTNSTHLPTEVTELRGKNVRNITGGVHHTVVLTDSEVFTFGKNDEGQLGLGKDFEEPEEVVEEKPVEEKTPKAKAPPKSNKKSSKKGKSSKKPEKEEEEKAGEGEGEAKETQPAEENKEAPAIEEKAVEEPKEEKKLKGKAKGKATQDKIEEEKVPEHQLIRKPVALSLPNVEKIYSGPDFNYAVTKENEVYSWGLGSNLVLGTNNEEAVYIPTKVDAGFFEGKKIVQIGLGSQHVIVLANESGEVAQLEEEVVEKIEAAGKSTKKGTTGKKGAEGTIGKKGKGKMEEEAEEAPEIKKDLSKPLEEKEEKKGAGKRKASEEEREDLKKPKKSSEKSTKKSESKEADQIEEEKPEEPAAEVKDEATTEAQTTTMAEEKEEKEPEKAEEKPAEAIQEEKPEEEAKPSEEKPAEETQVSEEKSAEPIQEEKPEEETKASEEKPAEESQVNEEKPAEANQEEKASE